jgi:hypothetical protein
MLSTSAHAEPMRPPAEDVRADADLSAQIPALAAFMGRPAALWWVHERSGRCLPQESRHMLPSWRAKKPFIGGIPAKIYRDRFAAAPLAACSPMM